MKRYFWGPVLIVLGLAALLQGTGAYDLGLSFWPVVLTLVGFAITVESFASRRGPQWFGLALGLWLGAMGLFEILNDAGITPEIDGGKIASAGWPILLIAIGVSIVFGKGVRVIFDGPRHRDWDHRGSGQHQVIGDLRYGRAPWVLEGDLNLSNAVGDLKLDLTTADITPGLHKIQVSQFVGETQIRVPDNVTVRVSAEAGVGELEVFGDKRSGASLFLQKEVVLPDSPAQVEINAFQRVGALRVLRVPVPPLTLKVME